MNNRKNKMASGNRVFTFFAYVFLCSLAILVLVPFAFALFGSFKTAQEILISPNLFPEEWHFENYVTAWEKSNFKQYAWNSAWYAAGMVVISVFTSTMCGYAFAREQFRGCKLIFGIFSSLMFITLGTSSMYPTLQILRLLGLSNSLTGLLVKQFFAISVTDIFLVRGYIRGLPASLDEAAEMDGCNFLQTFFLVILPLCKPIIATVAIFSFTHAWNDYLYPMIVTLTDRAARPLSVGLVALKGSSDMAASWNLILAGAMISAVPMVIVFLIFNKFFIKGLTSGAVKG